MPYGYRLPFITPFVSVTILLHECDRSGALVFSRTTYVRSAYGCRLSIRAGKNLGFLEFFLGF